MFIHKGEHIPYIFPIIVLFKFVKVNIKVLGGERGPKNEVLKIGRLALPKFAFMYKKELFSVIGLISTFKFSILIRILEEKIEKILRKI